MLWVLFLLSFWVCGAKAAPNAQGEAWLTPYQLSVAEPAHTLPKNSALEAKVAKVLSPYVQSIDRTIATYHWENTDTPFSKKFDTSPEGDLQRFKTQAGSFLGDNMKFGFYLATDPVGSRQFGTSFRKDVFRVVQVELPKGFKYIDLRRDAELEAKLLPLLGGDCAGKFANKIVNDHYHEDLCADLKRSVLKKLGVRGIRYIWQPSKIKSVCSGNDFSAFILTDSDWVIPEKVKVFTADSVDRKLDRQRISEILVSQGAALEGERGKPLWPDLPQDGRLTAGTKQWMRESLLNCQGDKPAAEEPEEARKGDSAE